MTLTMSETETQELSEFQTRSIEIREVNDEKREVSGLAVPYGVVADVEGYKESFERGAFAESDPKDILLFSTHGHRQGKLPIGKIVEGRETDEGYFIRARISETPLGDEVYQLLRDKVLTKFSIGFKPREHKIVDDIVVRTKAILKEVSVAAFPVYSTAAVSEVRSETENKGKEKQMSEVETVSTEEVADLRESVTDLERRITVITEDRDAGNEKETKYRSGGELLKALARGDEDAQIEIREFGDTADANVVRPGWVQRALKFKTEKRKIINLFDQGPLPDSGNTVEYPVVDYTATVGTRGGVSEQSAEGAALEYMEVVLDTGSATVGTYGGYSSLSRQAIERSDLAYLDAVLKYQSLMYSKATNAAARAALTSAVGTGTATLGADSAVGWIDLTVDAAGAIEDDSLGLEADFMVVSRDVFKRIMAIVDSAGRPLFAIKGDGVNTIGSGNIVRARFDIGGLPGVVDPSLAANTCKVASEDAITTLESSGAPFRLQDESIVNLTKDFSLYGYLATTLNDALGIVSCDVDLVA